MKDIPHRTPRIAAQLLLLALIVPILAACGGGTPAAQNTPVPAAPTAVPPAAVATTAVPAAPAATTAAPAAVATTAAPVAEATTAAPAAPAATTAAPAAAATTAAPAGTSAATEPNDKVLVLGDTQAPATLYVHEHNASATSNILSAMGQCFTSLDYDYQSVCFEELPTLDNGGAVTRTAQIDPAAISVANPIVIGGDLYTDTAGIEAAGVTVPATLDQFVVTWKLIEGITWEDGTPVTAGDFAFSLQLAKDPGTQNPTRFVEDRTIGYETPDDQTIVATFAPGYTSPTYFIELEEPLPEHVLGDQEPGEIGASDYAAKPLAWGPYRIEEHIPNEQITMVPNPNYFRASEGLPKVGTVIFKFIAEQDQVLAQLESGDIDYAGTLGLTLGQTEALERLETEGIIKPLFVPGTTWEHLDFGVARGDGQPAFFEDVKVRQAMAYGINRSQIIESVLFGRTVTMNSFLPDDHPFYPAGGNNITQYTYDKARAQQLLTEAGWVAGADGKLAKDGQPFEITLYTTENNATRQAAAEIVQQNLADLGITLELQFVPGTGKLFLQGADGILSARVFDIGLYAWSASPNPSTALYLCDQIPSADNGYAGQNYSGYCNEEYDTVALPAASELNRERRLELVADAQAVFNRDLPALPLYQRPKIAAPSAKVTGAAPNATQLGDFWNIYDWDITE